MWDVIILTVFLALCVLGWALNFALIGHLAGCRFDPPKSKRFISAVSAIILLPYLAVTYFSNPLFWRISDVWIYWIFFGPLPIGFWMFYSRYDAWKIGIRNTWFKKRT